MRRARGRLGAPVAARPRKRGCALARNSLFRPTLRIFGLLLGDVVFSAPAACANATCVLAADGTTGHRLIDPVPMIVTVGMPLPVHYWLAVNSYSLITELPDRAARWSGASGEGLGEESEVGESRSVIIGGTTSQARGAFAGYRGKGSGKDGGPGTRPVSATGSNGGETGPSKGTDQ